MSSYQQAFQDPHLRNESQSRQSNWESKLSPDENWSVEENSKEYGRGNEGSRALVLTSAPTRSKGATKSKSEPTSPASKTGRSGKSDGSSHHRPQSPRNGSSAPRHQVNQPAERRSSCPRLLVTPTDPIFGGLAATNVRRPPVTIDGRPYSTLEHYYHAMKFSATNPDLARKFQAGSASDPPLSAAQARRLAWRNGDLVREDWEGQCRVAVMRRGLEQLLRQEAGALTALVRGTIGREIIVEEDSSGTEDEFAIELGAGDGWARAQESREVEYWYGRANRYGRLLMALRDGLAQTRDL
ncbi:hypothetical protein DFJ73DRAFT_783093 [Zopfochytrium polystomum]|nr:hypothetical protein DFJ73DRAFT_783093 [Zopfochytrium polystomum]